MSKNANAINYFSPAKWVVSTIPGQGTHTTINAAYASASAGDLIAVLPGTYSAPYSVKAGVALCGLPGSEQSQIVLITGQGSYAGGVATSIADVCMVSNIDYSFLYNGSAQGNLVFQNVKFNNTGHNGVNFSNSNSLSTLYFVNCNDQDSTTYAPLDQSSPGLTKIAGFYSGLKNATCSISAGNLILLNSEFNNSISLSGNSALQIYAGTKITVTGTNCILMSGTSTFVGSEYSLYSSGPVIYIGATSTANIGVCNLVNISTGYLIDGVSGGVLQLGFYNASTSSGGTTSTFNPVLTIIKNITTIGNLNLPTALSVPNGGTGINSIASGAIVFGSGSNTLNTLAPASNGDVLQLKSGVPAWSTPSFPISVGGSGTILRSDGTNWAATTATYPTTTTINQLLYSSSANAISGLATANSAVLATNASGVPSLTTTPTVTSMTFGAGTALSSYVEGTWTPTIDGSVSGTTTYTSQYGFYTVIGNICIAVFNVSITGATGTGYSIIGGFPKTFKNQTGNAPTCAIYFSGSGWTWSAGSTQILAIGQANTTTANLGSIGSAVNANNLTMANASATIRGVMIYQF